MAFRLLTSLLQLRTVLGAALCLDPAATYQAWIPQPKALALNNTSNGSTPPAAVFNVTNGALAVATWIRIHDTTKRTMIALCHGDGGVNKFLFEISLNRLSFYSYFTDQLCKPAFTLTIDTDYFVAFRYDYSLSGPNLFLYIAAVGDTTLSLLGSYTITAPMTSTTNTVMDFGFVYSDGGVVSYATIDGWRCYTTVMVAQLEADMYHQTTYATAPVAAYSFNQLPGMTAVTDVSGNNRHATIKPTSQRVAQTVPFTA